MIKLDTIICEDFTCEVYANVKGENNHEDQIFYLAYHFNKDGIYKVIPFGIENNCCYEISTDDIIKIGEKHIKDFSSRKIIKVIK